jgi:circadian clock protein KaiC
VAGEKKGNRTSAPGIKKSPTGIGGFDEITGGGLPTGRPTLICGAAGCGKTLFSTTFLVKGATEYDEPGVLMTFEERSQDIVDNVASLGYRLDELIANKQIAIDHVRVERSEIEEAGEFDLEGLFVRLNFAIDSIGAKRVVLDTIESLFGGFTNQVILRAELRRLFDWLKDKGVTAIVTGERGDGQLTRHGLEEYISDCVVLLDHRVDEQISTRRLRVVKYRGSSHGTNEYPFLIDDQGIHVIPITSAGLEHKAGDERVATGVPALDEMLGGRGYIVGSTVLVSGMAGAGKSSLAAHFADSACRSGERCLYFAMEESPQQIMRNMRSIGMELRPHVAKGTLRFLAKRPTFVGLEMHLALMHREIETFQPSAVVVDPISAFVGSGTQRDIYAMLLRLVDHLKTRGITALFTTLTHGLNETGVSDTGLSSLMDTWLLLFNREANGEFNRELYVLKSRGMAHSNQVREFVLTNDGIELRDVYIGAEGVLTGSARLVQAAREEAEILERKQAAERRERDAKRKRHQIEAQIAALRAEIEADEAEVALLTGEAEQRARQLETDRQGMSEGRAGRGSRKADQPRGRRGVARDIKAAS